MAVSANYCARQKKNLPQKSVEILNGGWEGVCNFTWGRQTLLWEEIIEKSNLTEP